MNPFQVSGPAAVSFSFGRTSAYMLRRMLDAGLEPDVHVLFANTGKEDPRTLDFGHACETWWGVKVHWLEYLPPDGKKTMYREVTYETASRNGEPFEALIAHRKRLPNPLMRICTQELKIRPMREWMKDHGYKHWVMPVGLRADEPRRVAKMKARNEAGKERWEIVMPLASAGVTEEDVLSFWKCQPFDLQLRTWEGNCDLCFLKSQAKKVRIIQERPELAEWWVRKEQQYEPFRRNARTYADLVETAKHLPVLQAVAGAPDDAMDCLCTD